MSPDCASIEMTRLRHYHLGTIIIGRENALPKEAAAVEGIYFPLLEQREARAEDKLRYIVIPSDDLMKYDLRNLSRETNRESYPFGA